MYGGDFPSKSHFVVDDKARLVEYKVVQGANRKRHRVIRWLNADRALLDRDVVAQKIREARRRHRDLIAVAGFICPECGGGWFGTTNPNDDFKLVPQRVECHDELGRACTWKGLASEAGL